MFKDRSHAFALEHDPFVIESWQQLAAIERQRCDEIVGRDSFSRALFHVRHIQPIVGLRVKPYSDVVHQQRRRLARPGRFGFDGLAQTPQFVPEVLASILLLRIGPEQSREFLAAMQSARREKKVSQERLGGA